MELMKVRVDIMTKYVTMEGDEARVGCDNPKGLRTVVGRRKDKCGATRKDTG